ncbi:hypothetical protein BASA60_007313 [Batrachochytrium salamandrivorans]|nr:hypothetical protein BASA60_007313 [Batrachochytrium salamandrivorans]
MTHAAIEFSKVYASLSYMLSDSITTSDLQPLPTSSQPSTVIQRAGSVLSTSLHGSVSTSHHSSIRLDGVDKTDTSDRLGHTLPLDTHIDTVCVDGMPAFGRTYSIDMGNAVRCMLDRSSAIKNRACTPHSRFNPVSLDPNNTPESREALDALGCLDTMAAGSVLPHTVVLSPDISASWDLIHPHMVVTRVYLESPGHRISGIVMHMSLIHNQTQCLGSPSATKRCSSRSNLFPRHQSLMTQITRSTAGSSSGKSSGISDHSIFRLAARATSIHGGIVQGAGTDSDGSLMYFPIYAGHPLCSTSIHDHSMASSDQSYGTLLSASAPCAPRIYKQNPIVQGSVTNLISHDSILGRTRTIMAFLYHGDRWTSHAQ